MILHYLCSQLFFASFQSIGLLIKFLFSLNQHNRHLADAILCSSQKLNFSAIDALYEELSVLFEKGLYYRINCCSNIPHSNQTKVLKLPESLDLVFS